MLVVEHTLQGADGTGDLQYFTRELLQYGPVIEERALEEI